MEVHLLLNILGVLFLTNFKSHLKSFTGDPNQNDQETGEETGKEGPRTQGGSQMQKMVGHKCTSISFSFCHYREIGGGWGVVSQGKRL